MKKILQPRLMELLPIDYPIIVAPMFLVSNIAMLEQACNFGAAAAVPSLNYRTGQALEHALIELKEKCRKGAYGVNLIVNKSNNKLREHLSVCLKHKPHFIITSLGSPREVIEKCKPLGIKVFCDVVDLGFAKKVEALGADAVIAVCKEAGGHAGPLSADQLVPELKDFCSIPVISAGGVSTGEGVQKRLKLGADGLSIGSMFIATEESAVSREYKEAVVRYGAKDIVFTDKLSGTPCTVINTPYLQRIGTEQNWLERLLNRNKYLKKYVKMLTFYKGMKKLQRAAFGATYKTLWVAGPSIENVKEVLPMRKMLQELLEGVEVKGKGS